MKEIDVEKKKWLRRHQIYEIKPEPVFVDLLRSTGIDSQPVGPVREPNFRAKLHMLAESIPGLQKHLQLQAQDSILDSARLGIDS
jgi:hypothetical protein